KYWLYTASPVVRQSSAAAHNLSSAHSLSPYSPVVIPGGFFEDNVGIFSGPEPRFSGRFQVARSKIRIERRVEPRGDRCHGRKVRGCASTLVRLLPGSNHFARQVIILRHHEAREIFAGLLVPHPAVFILHLEHPFKVPARFVQDVGHTISAL